MCLLKLKALHLFTILQAKVDTGKLNLEVVIWIWHSFHLPWNALLIKSWYNYSSVRVFSSPRETKREIRFLWYWYPRKGTRQIWDSRNWQGRGERKEASTLLIVGLPAALCRSVKQTAASAIPFLVSLNVQTPEQELWGYYQFRFSKRDKIKHIQMLVRVQTRSLSEIFLTPLPPCT